MGRKAGQRYRGHSKVYLVRLPSAFGRDLHSERAATRANENPKLSVFCFYPEKYLHESKYFSCCFFALKMLGNRGEMHFIPIHDSWPKSSAHRPPSLSIEGGSCSEVSDRVTNLALCTHQRKMGCLF